MLNVGPDGIPTAQRLTYAINHFLIRALVGVSAEELIPDTEDASVVLVDAVVVLAMMHPMVRGRDHETLEDSHATDELRVYPVLIEQIDQRHDDEDLRRNTE